MGIAGMAAIVGTAEFISLTKPWILASFAGSTFFTSIALVSLTN